MIRTGIGYDVHELVYGRKLILGGIEIPYKMGLSGHSDADVLVHAICDALLGAAGLGDIGIYFPDNDPKFKNICSLELLIKSREMIQKTGYTVNNIDSTVFAEAPKLNPYKDAMQKKISETLDIHTGLVNIKATTTEGLGFIGKGKGIAAMSIVTIY